ncbi:MAG: cytochrome c peroxidase [Candidatus Omnitrophota bacterium]
MKKLLILAALALAGGLALPVSNILIFKGTPFRQYAQTGPAAAAIRPILEKKCVSCHSPHAEVPYYAAWPVAREIIGADIRAGTARFNAQRHFNPPGGGPVGEAALAELEYVTGNGSMPPLKFLALHWDSLLLAEDKRLFMNFIHETRKAHYATRLAAPLHQDDALQPLPDKVPTNPVKVTLGSKLYHDVRLSGDGKISCATCHDLALGGTDREKVSTGIRDQLGPINAPTVFNAVFNFVQFWDGRAKDLKEQAGGPVTNPKEMGANWPDVLATLSKDSTFTEQFRAVYRDGLSAGNIQDAIAEFEKTLVTPDSAFDRYLKGNPEALTPREREGLRLFRQRGCYTCHVGKIVGGQSYEKMGLRRNYFADRGNVTEADAGRYNVTKKEEDRHFFKVPTLRNIALTYPYFHDGSTGDLTQAVKVMAKYQTENPMSDAEASRVAEFLKTLTGEYLGKKLS